MVGKSQINSSIPPHTQPVDMDAKRTSASAMGSLCLQLTWPWSVWMAYELLPNDTMVGGSKSDDGVRIGTPQTFFYLRRILSR